MSAPARQRPTGRSPIKLVADVEQVRTPVASPAGAAPLEAPPEAAEQTSPEITASATSAPVATQPVSRAADSARKPVTVTLSVETKRRAETAVMRTAGRANGYTSFSSLVEGAIEHELARLAEEHNAGEPFPPNEGAFRQGRPLGS